MLLCAKLRVKYCQEVRWNWLRNLHKFHPFQKETVTYRSSPGLSFLYPKLLTCLYIVCPVYILQMVELTSPADISGLIKPTCPLYCMHKILALDNILTLKFFCQRNLKTHNEDQSCPSFLFWSFTIQFLGYKEFFSFFPNMNLYWSQYYKSCEYLDKKIT